METASNWSSGTERCNSVRLDHRRLLPRQQRLEDSWGCGERGGRIPASSRRSRDSRRADFRRSYIAARSRRSRSDLVTGHLTTTMRMRLRERALRGACAILLVCLGTLLTVPMSTGQRWDPDRPDRFRDPFQGPPPVGPPFQPPPGSNEDLDLRYPPPDFWPWGRPPKWPPRRPTSTAAPRTTPSTPTTTPPSTTTINPARLVDAVGAPVNCTCPATHEFNPVCGTNGATYNSPVKMRCAQRCGYDVQLAHYGNCPQRTTGRK